MSIHNIPVEAWKCLQCLAVNPLFKTCNKMLECEKLPQEQRKRTLISITKNQVIDHNCSNYKVIKLVSLTTKIWKRVLERRLRDEVKICEYQYGFMLGKSAMDVLFVLRMLTEIYKNGQKELHRIFMNLENEYDTVPSEEL